MGKSTLVEVLLKEKNLDFLNADEIAKEISPNAIDKVQNNRKSKKQNYKINLSSD